jgi:hypothetical protein
VLDRHQRGVGLSKIHVPKRHARCAPPRAPRPRSQRRALARRWRGTMRLEGGSDRQKRRLQSQLLQGCRLGRLQRLSMLECGRWDRRRGGRILARPRANRGRCGQKPPCRS